MVRLNLLGTAVLRLIRCSLNQLLEEHLDRLSCTAVESRFSACPWGSKWKEERTDDEWRRLRHLAYVLVRLHDLLDPRL